MSVVDNFTLDLPKSQQELMIQLDALMLSFPGVTCRLHYNTPFYYRKKWICYLSLTKGESVEICFVKGHLLSNEQGLLEAKKRKLVRGITFAKTAEIPEAVLAEIIQEALLLDETQRP